MQRGGDLPKVKTLLTHEGFKTEVQIRVHKTAVSMTKDGGTNNFVYARK